MSIRLSGLGIALIIATTGFAKVLGGWAVTTVEDLPERFVAGQPVELAFVVRQHGVRRLGGLTEGRVVAENGRQVVEAPARASGATGRYVSALRLPREGRWTITVHSGFPNSTLRLLPVMAVERSSATVATAAHERGRVLFVAKGCVSCHTHGAIDQRPIGNVGPELTARRYDADYLAKFLTNPAAIRPSSANRMPDLELKDREIAALVAFINDRAAAGVARRQ